MASQDCDNHTLLTGGGGGERPHTSYSGMSHLSGCFSKPLRSDFNQYALKLGLVSR